MESAIAIARMPPITAYKIPADEQNSPVTRMYTVDPAIHQCEKAIQCQRAGAKHDGKKADTGMIRKQKSIIMLGRLIALALPESPGWWRYRAADSGKKDQRRKISVTADVTPPAHNRQCLCKPGPIIPPPAVRSISWWNTSRGMAM